MSYVLEAKAVKSAEFLCDKLGKCSLTELMENAGVAVTEQILKIEDIENKKTVIFCGKGNNGGDGYVIARLLKEKGFKVIAVYTELPATDLAREMFDKAVAVGVKTVCFADFFENDIAFDIAVDAVFGTGFSKPIDELYSSVIKTINENSKFTVSVDIPSGLYAGSGKVPECCVKADFTVTFFSYKQCLLLPPASSMCGKVFVADIGIEQSLVPKTDILAETVDADFLKYSIPKRDKNSHKGIFGTLGAVVGSKNYKGAAVLSVKSAVRSGAGIVKAITTKEVIDVIINSVPEAVYGNYRNSSDVLKQIADCTAAIIGCGMGATKNTKKIVQNILKNAKIPIVLDADGINVMCDSIDIIKQSECNVIITPHPKEASRLLGVTVEEIQKNRFKYAKLISEKCSAVTVLKGANTIISSPDGKLFVVTDGNPGMATAGSGDVLSGIIGGLLSMGLDTLTAAICGVKIHAMAGDMACVQFSEISMTPSDIINKLPELFVMLG